MDPLTQGALGAALPLATRHRKQAGVAAACGFLAGLAPDLDVLIRDPDDSLLFLEYHRQFTHALIFIPVGSALVAAAVYGLGQRWLSIGFLNVWLFCALGFATHGALDAATSYGTQLFWPFDETRVVFSIISIVDPLFTLPVMGLVGLGMVRGNGRWGCAALLWAMVYLGLGAIQHQSALSQVRMLAESRGHAPVRIVVKPTFGNIILWRGVYEADGRFHVDAVRPGPWLATIAGTSVARLDTARDFPWLAPASRQAHDIERFRRFSQNYIAKATDGSARVIDVRYGFIPTEISALWSIRLDPDAGPDAHTVYETDRAKARQQLQILLRMIFARP